MAQRGKLNCWNGVANSRGEKRKRVSKFEKSGGWKPLGLPFCGEERLNLEHIKAGKG